VDSERCQQRGGGSVVGALALRCLLGLAAVLALSGATLAAGVSLTVEMPEGVKPVSAKAMVPAMKLESPGKIDGRTIIFGGLLPDTHYDLEVTGDDGAVYRGADLSWYDDEAPDPHVAPMNDDDHDQVRALVSDVKQFYDKSEILVMRGDHDRATVLVQQTRSTPFHSGKDNEVIWRIEMWYFRNRHGGWERVSQQNKVLRRERFSSEQFWKETQKLHWVPALGGVMVSKAAGTATLKLTAEALKPQPPQPSAPASQPHPESGEEHD
jgi:hypothetical protein